MRSAAAASSARFSADHQACSGGGPLSGGKRVKETPTSSIALGASDSYAAKLSEVVQTVTTNANKTDAAMLALDAAFAQLGVSVDISSSATGAPTLLSEPRVVETLGSAGGGGGARGGGTASVAPEMRKSSAAHQDDLSHAGVSQTEKPGSSAVLPLTPGERAAALEELEACLFSESSPPEMTMLEIDALLLISTDDAGPGSQPDSHMASSK